MKSVYEIFERIKLILKVVEEAQDREEYLTCDEISEKLDCEYEDLYEKAPKTHGAAPHNREKKALLLDRKTILRTLKIMQDIFAIPIYFNQEKGGFELKKGYLENSSRLFTISFSDNELFSLMIVKKLVQQYNKFPFFREFERVIQKLLKTFDNKTQEKIISYSAYEKIINKQHAKDESGSEKTSYIENFIWVLYAIINTEELEIVYEKIRTDSSGKFIKVEKTPRIIQPYNLIFKNEDWYVFAFCKYRNKERFFKLDQMRDIINNYKKFDRKESFLKKEKLGEGIDSLFGDKEYNIKLKLLPPLSLYFRNKIIHPSQTLVKNKDNSTIITFKTITLAPIVRWVLEKGPQVIVIEPSILREKVLSNAGQIIDLYKNG